MSPARRSAFPRSSATIARAAARIAVLLAFVAGAAASARAGAEVDRYVGVVANGRTDGAVTATLAVRPVGPRDRLLEIAEAHAGTRLTAFDVDMTKRLHLIAISDDFTTFAHLHPTLDATGRFTIVFHAPKSGGYHLYADASPTGFGQRVFRFDLPVTIGNFDASGRPAPHVAHAPPVLAPTGPIVRAGAYAIALGAVDLRARAATTISVSIAKDGKPATDLHPYLGGAGHAVFIAASSLAYLHLHPETAQMAPMPEMSGDGSMKMDAPPLPPDARIPARVTLRVPPLAPGSYKLWYQFSGGGKLWVAPFAIVVRSATSAIR